MAYFSPTSQKRVAPKSHKNGKEEPRSKRHRWHLRRCDKVTHPTFFFVGNRSSLVSIGHLASTSSSATPSLVTGQTFLFSSSGSLNRLPSKRRQSQFSKRVVTNEKKSQCCLKKSQRCFYDESTESFFFHFYPLNVPWPCYNWIVLHFFVWI